MIKQDILIPVVCICFGLIYLVKPDIFQRGFWKRTAISQRLLTTEQNKVYMRILGAIFLIGGVIFLALRLRAR